MLGGAGTHSEPLHIHFPSGLNIGSDMILLSCTTLTNNRPENSPVLNQILHRLSWADTDNRHIISMKSEGSVEPPQDIMEEYNGCSAPQYTRYPQSHYWVYSGLGCFIGDITIRFIPQYKTQSASEQERQFKSRYCKLDKISNPAALQHCNSDKPLIGQHCP